jgi:hypothetical protein
MEQGVAVNMEAVGRVGQDLFLSAFCAAPSPVFVGL